ncbi:RNA polymerase sigma factor [Pedobacter caeni]|uniref:RNA polymerase sigma-70 factor, ECF subfamily n=1 Tax=Pedobacter caeni TaxID=288992 RepID=A0A1M5H016_9SPHI|nr:RNA polymerase sigma-70 factor [Pedobacter caeni]SHG09359.1 RNA polymerase sigma-70 factor, ECF subfamily [Pedobacter caeni]
MENKGQHELQGERMLLQDAARGSREAFAAIYKFYLPRLYKYIYPFVNSSREDTEEILHDLFMKVWERKEELSDINSFSSYLYRMARNRLVNIYEHGKVKQKAIDYISSHTEASGNQADEPFITAQYNTLVQNAINLLPPKRRQIFEMSVYQEMSHDEIATELQISKSMVKKQLYSAVRYLKEYLRVHADLTAIILCCSAVLRIK